MHIFLVNLNKHRKRKINIEKRKRKINIEKRKRKNKEFKLGMCSQKFFAEGNCKVRFQITNVPKIYPFNING